MAANNARTQDFVPIKEIRDNIVIQKTGQMVMILLASSVNFALKSADEQQAILQQFQQFLNTLDFSLQIHMQSRRLNVEPYLAVLAELEDKQDNDLMRIQLKEYIEFIRSFTADVDVMSKNFFVVVPYTAAKVNLGKGLGIFSPGGGAGRSMSDANFAEYRTQLEQRVSLITEGLARLGVRTIVLGKDELVELYYHIYNPSDSTGSAPLMEVNI
jgi:type IV secretory pathway VirB4 component